MFKEIENTNGCYLVNEFGKVKSIARASNRFKETILKTNIDNLWERIN